MQLTLYKNFKKRINSTKRPSGGATQEVYLKQDTSLKNPTFILEDVDLDVNYCKYADHYYYVTDITLNMCDQYELVCSMDDLASHKDEIGNTTAYVELSSNDFNKWIPDARLSMSNETEVKTSKNANAPIIGTSTSTANIGNYVISVAGNDENACVGLSEVYICDNLALSQIMESLYRDWVTELQQFFVDVKGALFSCHWVPFDGDFDMNDTVFIGDFPLKLPDGSGHDVTAHAYGNNEVHESHRHTTIDIPWIYNDWRDFSPYSTLECYLPLIGLIDIDSSKLYGETSMDVDVYFDYISGDITYTLSAGTFYKEYKQNCAVPLAITSAQDNSLKGALTTIGGAVALAGSIGAGVVGGLSNQVLTGGVGGIVGIGKGVSTIFNQNVTTGGSNGNFAGADSIISKPANYLYRYVVLRQISHKFGVETPSSINSIEGRPLFDTRRISDIPGYIKCAGASVNMAGLESDKVTINNYLNSGFYYE